MMALDEKSEDIRIHPERDMNVCSNFMANLQIIVCDIPAWTKVEGRSTDRHCHSQSRAASMAKNGKEITVVDMVSWSGQYRPLA